MVTLPVIRHLVQALPFFWTGPPKVRSFLLVCNRNWDICRDKDPLPPLPGPGFATFQNFPTIKRLSNRKGKRSQTGLQKHMKRNLA